MGHSTKAVLLVTLFVLCAIPAFALVPGVDPSAPTRNVYRRGEYRGSTESLPPPSSSSQKVSISSRLGEDFPKTVFSPTYSGRSVGPAAYEPRNFLPTTRKQAPKRTLSSITPTKSKNPPSLLTASQASGPTTFGGSNKDFPKTVFTRQFQGRWSGSAKLQ